MTPKTKELMENSEVSYDSATLVRKVVSALLFPKTVVTEYEVSPLSSEYSTLKVSFTVPHTGSITEDECESLDKTRHLQIDSRVLAACAHPKASWISADWFMRNASSFTVAGAEIIIPNTFELAY